MLVNGRTERRDGNSPFNEGFEFTAEQYALMRKLRPDLFEYGDAQARRKKWVEFANTSIGRAFRRR